MSSDRTTLTADDVAARAEILEARGLERQQAIARAVEMALSEIGIDE